MTKPDRSDDAKQNGEDSALTSLAVTVTAQDLPLHCPGDKAPLWSMHPKVYLDVSKTGSVKCHYCGTLYTLAPGTVIDGHGH